MYAQILGPLATIICLAVWYDAQIKYFFKKCQSSISNTKLCKAMRPQQDIKLR